MYNQLTIEDTFNIELPSDPIQNNYTRQVTEAAFSFVSPLIPKQPELIHASKVVLALLGLDKNDAVTNAFLSYFSGSKIHPKTKPYAMAYAGHQFGNWAGQLGDGRAINLFEVKHHNKRWAIQLKGVGKTPYSRRGDGLAVLRSSVREYLCSEAMHHLGVPTTRGLSLMKSGDLVLRDVLYNGNADYEKGAIVARVAPSFIRFGNFELFAARKDIKNLKILTDYTIKYFYPQLGQPSKETYLKFFEAVAENTQSLLIHWQRVGFVHGVMNTDNMSILGLTIDYGPYGWLEGFDLNWTPNTTDAEHKRYRYGNQPNIGLWNLLQLANALYPLIEDATGLQAILDNYPKTYDDAYLKMMRSKLGLFLELETDKDLIAQLESNLMLIETDMTIFFRQLAKVEKGNATESLLTITNAFYTTELLNNELINTWNIWFNAYNQRLQKEELTDIERCSKMNTVNPKYVLRNYMAQLAINEADKGDYSLIHELFTLLKNPYNEQPEHQKWFAKRPEWARHKVGCSMLSCSS